MGAGHQDPGYGDGPHEVYRVDWLRAVQRRPGHLDELVHRNAVGMFRQGRERLQQLGPVGGRLAHADDAAAAYLHARVAHVLKRVQPVLVGSCRDDLAVEIFGGIQVVVVVVEAGFFQFRGLLGRNHPQCRAGLHSQCVHLADHLLDDRQLLRFRASVGGAHAESRRAASPGLAGLLDDALHGHECLVLQPGVIADALRTVRAVLRAGAGLDAAERAHLDLIGREEPAVHGLCAEDEVVERHGEQLTHLPLRPVVPDQCLRRRVSLCHYAAVSPICPRWRRPGASRSWPGYRFASIRARSAAVNLQEDLR